MVQYFDWNLSIDWNKKIDFDSGIIPSLAINAKRRPVLKPCVTSSWDSCGQQEGSAERDHALTGLWDMVGTRLLPPVCWSMDHGVSWFPSHRRFIPRAELTEQRTAVCSYHRSLVLLKHSDKHPAVDEGSVNRVLLDRLNKKCVASPSPWKAHDLHTELCVSCVWASKSKWSQAQLILATGLFPNSFP